MKLITLALRLSSAVEMVMLMPLPLLSAVVTVAAAPYSPPVPAQPLVLPPWTPTYELSISTALFPANQSGWWDTSLTAKFGLLDFDWSNAQAVWARPPAGHSCRLCSSRWTREEGHCRACTTTPQTRALGPGLGRLMTKSYL